MKDVERCHCRSDNFLIKIVADSVTEQVQNCHVAFRLYGGLSHAGMTKSIKF